MQNSRFMKIRQFRHVVNSRRRRLRIFRIYTRNFCNNLKSKPMPIIIFNAKSLTIGSKIDWFNQPSEMNISKRKKKVAESKRNASKIINQFRPKSRGRLNFWNFISHINKLQEETWSLCEKTKLPLYGINLLNITFPFIYKSDEFFVLSFNQYKPNMKSETDKQFILFLSFILKTTFLFLFTIKELHFTPTNNPKRKGKKKHMIKSKKRTWEVHPVFLEFPMFLEIKKKKKKLTVFWLVVSIVAFLPLISVTWPSIQASSGSSTQTCDPTMIFTGVPCSKHKNQNSPISINIFLQSSNTF